MVARRTDLTTPTPPTDQSALSGLCNISVDVHVHVEIGFTLFMLAEMLKSYKTNIAVFWEIIMNKEEAISLIRERRITEWNAYRNANPKWAPDLSNIDFSDMRLVAGNLAFNFSRASLFGSKFTYKEALLDDKPHKRGHGFLYNKYVVINLQKALINLETTFPIYFDPIKYGAVFVSDTDPRSNTNTPTVFISYAWVTCPQYMYHLQS